MDLFAQILIEIFVQVVGEIVGNALSHAIFNDRVAQNRKGNSILAGIGYALLGAIFGFITLIALHRPIFDSQLSQLLALIGTVLFMGLIASALGQWRRRRGRTVLRVDRFVFGALFGLGFGLVRFFAL